MALLNTFDSKTTEVTVSRLEKLNHTTAPQWGKMNSAQMLAHLNVTYDLAYDKIQPTGNFFTKFLVKILVKPIVVSEKPYKKTLIQHQFLLLLTSVISKKKNQFLLIT